jgi:acyl carrier protein
MERQDIVDTVKQFILAEFLPGEEPEEFANDAPLMTSGIIDPSATMKLITFLEQEFDITVEPHEADAANLNTVDAITDFVDGKL